MKRAFIFCTLGILFGILALGTDRQAIRADGDTPTPTMIDNDDVVMELGNGLSIISKASHDEFTSPRLVMDVCWPTLAGGTGATVDNFNQAVDQIVKDTAGRFKDDTSLATPNAALPADIAAKGSSFTLWYEIATANSSIVSLKFHVTTYTPGDAHPVEYSVTLNYDVKGSAVLALKDLFKPDADYLKVISNYSVTTLTSAGKLFFPEGAQPTEENYSRWNIDVKALRITFDAGLVAPRVVGAQEVKIPFSELKSIISPSGVLADKIEDK